jgi:hypothetical protein
MTSETTTHRTSRILPGLLLFAALLPAAGAQTTDSAPGCTLSKQGYICDKASFHRLLKHSQTIAIDASPRDRIARKQLAELIVALGKSPTDGPADLTFALTPPDPAGVNIGPSDQELATLRVYGPSTDGKPGNLLWAETFRGQPDMRWPSAVHALMQQFQAEFAKR